MDFPDLKTAIDALKTTEADENAAADALVAAYALVPQRIADAVAAALAQGATTEQLADLSTLQGAIATEAQKMKDALAVPVPPGTVGSAPAAPKPPGGVISGAVYPKH